MKKHSQRTIARPARPLTTIDRELAHVTGGSGSNTVFVIGGDTAAASVMGGMTGGSGGVGLVADRADAR